MESKVKNGIQQDPVSVVEVGDHSTSTRKRPNYAPFVTRTPFLLFLCCIVLACTGALQYAVKRSIELPQQSSASSAPKLKRFESEPLGPTQTLRIYATSTTTILKVQMPRQDEPQTTTTPTTATTSEATPPAGEEPTPGGNDRTTTIPYAPTTGFVELESSTTIPPMSPVDPGVGPSTQPENDPIQVGPVTTQAVPSSGYAEITSGPTSSDRTLSSAAPSAYIEITGISVNQNGQTITSVASYHHSEIIYATYASSFTGSDGKVSTTLIVRPAQKTEGAIPEFINGQEVQIPVGKFGVSHYVYATYGPTFIAVILKILWACVYSGNKMMEPFYQLNRRSGASARESLMADYLSSGISWWSLKIMFKGHWTMLLTVLVSICISLLPSFATEAMTVKTMGLCLFSDGSRRRCNPVWILNLNMVRATQALLCLIAFCIIVIVLINLRRRSGVSANPSSIASMASLLHHPDIVREIQNIDIRASNEEVAASLAQNRYIIGTYRDAHGQERTGLMKASIDFNNALSSNNNTRAYRIEYTAVADPAAALETETNQRPLKRDTVDQLIDYLLVFLIVGILAVTLAFWFDGSESGFNRFFSVDRFGPRFIMTTAASLIAMAWLDLEREVRILSPYRRLARRNAPPQQTILATVDGYPHMSLFSSLRHRNLLHFSVALAAVSSDLLIIAVGSVPFSSAQIRWSFILGTWITVGVLGYMIPVVIGLLIWRRTNRKLAIPYQPNETLLRTWMGIANQENQIRHIFQDNNHNDVSGQRRQDDQDGTYWAGWIRDGNGRERWCVDRETSTSLLDYQPYRPRRSD